MHVTQRPRTLLAGVIAGALIGTGVAAVTPAGAAVKTAAASISWKTIWKTQIKPRADKRYYTKKRADARFYTKAVADSVFETKAAHDAALANYYTKAQSDANYYTKAQSDTNYYTKAQSDAKYAPYPRAIRGVYTADVPSGATISDSISFGVTLTAAPTVIFIPLGTAVPAGCLGTPSAPDAQPGNLCIFESRKLNVASVHIENVAGTFGTASPFGAAVVGVLTTTTAASFMQGSWALRPELTGVATSSSMSPAPSTGSQAFSR